MSENLRKLIGVAVMAAIVVVGVVATSGDDSDFDRTRNAAFVKLGDIKGGVKDDGAASKGGDCCDETLYRLGQIEDRLSRIETSLQQALPMVRDAQLVDDGPSVDQILALLEAVVGQDPQNVNPNSLANYFRDSDVLLGVPLQTAQEAVDRLGVGFVHRLEDGRDLDPVSYWGTRRSPQGHAGMVFLDTRNGLVSDVGAYVRWAD